MKLTITISDSTVYKDGAVIEGLVFEGVPDGVHALQWDGASGWIEFVNESEFKKPPNQSISELPTWALDAVQKWETQTALIEAQRAAEAAVNPPGTIPVTVTP